MKTKLRTVVSVATMAMLLSGCQSFPLTAWMFKSHARPEARPAPMLAGAQVLEEGRQELRNGQISAAVASFRLARRDPTTAADATNGLAVAFVRLGRLDLAERYFKAALAMQPDNDHFAANLLLLRHQVMLAEREQAARVAQAAAAQSAAEQSQAVAMAEPLNSNGQAVVHIVTRHDLGNAPDIKVAAADTSEPAIAQPGTSEAPRASGTAVSPKEIVFNR